MNMTLMFFLFGLLLVSFHILFYLRVIPKLIFAPIINKIFIILLAINLLFNILYIVGRYTNTTPYSLNYIFSLSIGLSFVLLLYLIVHEILHIFHKKISHIDKSKREFIKKGGDSTLFALSTAYISTASYEGSKKPVVNVVKLDRFDFSIVQISDFHIGGLIDREFVKASVEKINTLSPDIVFITGDLIDTALSDIKSSLLELESIESKYGVYFILGNHEYFHNPLEIIEFIKTTNIKILLNQNIIIDELELNVVGVTDIFGYKIDLLVPDIAKAFRGVNSKYKTILLAHQPKFIDEIEEYKIDLILSGHTHGGQIFPFNYMVKLQQPFVKGLHILPNGTAIYVNSGIGFWGPPMRLGSDAEIAYFI